MAKYHINGKGDTGLCSTGEGKCPFGDDSQHYTSPEGARAAFEASQLSGLAPKLSREDQRIKNSKTLMGLMEAKSDGKVTMFNPTSKKPEAAKKYAIEAKDYFLFSDGTLLNEGGARLTFAQAKNLSDGMISLPTKWANAGKNDYSSGSELTTFYPAKTWKKIDPQVLKEKLEKKKGQTNLARFESGYYSRLQPREQAPEAMEKAKRNSIDSRSQEEIERSVLENLAAIDVASEDIRVPALSMANDYAQKMVSAGGLERHQGIYHNGDKNSMVYYCPVVISETYGTLRKKTIQRTVMAQYSKATSDYHSQMASHWSGLVNDNYPVKLLTEQQRPGSTVRPISPWLRAAGAGSPLEFATNTDLATFSQDSRGLLRCIDQTIAAKAKLLQEGNTIANREALGIEV